MDWMGHLEPPVHLELTEPPAHLELTEPPAWRVEMDFLELSVLQDHEVLMEGMGYQGQLELLAAAMLCLVELNYNQHDQDNRYFMTPEEILLV